MWRTSTALARASRAQPSSSVARVAVAALDMKQTILGNWNDILLIINDVPLEVEQIARSFVHCFPDCQAINTTALIDELLKVPTGTELRLSIGNG